MATALKQNLEIRRICRVMKSAYSHSGRRIKEPQYYFDSESARDASETEWDYLLVLYYKESYGKERFFILQELDENVRH